MLSPGENVKKILMNFIRFLKMLLFFFVSFRIFRIFLDDTVTLPLAAKRNGNEKKNVQYVLE